MLSSSLQEGNHISIEFRVVIQDGITTQISLGKRFPQLLHHPISGRMTSDVGVQDLTPAMLDYEEADKNWNVSVGTVKESKETITSR